MSFAHTGIPSDGTVHLGLCYVIHWPGSQKFPTLPNSGIPGRYWESSRSKLILLMMGVISQEPVPVISIPERENSREGLLMSRHVTPPSSYLLGPSVTIWHSLCRLIAILTCTIFFDLAMYLNTHLISLALELKYLGPYYTRNTPTSICLSRGLERKLEFCEQIRCLVGQK